MANYHNLLSKCDRALAAYLISEGAGTVNDVIPAKRSKDRPGTCTICYCERAVEAAPYSGTYLVSAAVIVRYPGSVEVSAEDADAGLASDDRVAKTFDAFHKGYDTAGTDLADDITAAARALAISDPDNHADLEQLTVQNVSVREIGAGFEGDSWTDTMDLELLVCPVKLA